MRPKKQELCIDMNDLMPLIRNVMDEDMGELVVKKMAGEIAWGQTPGSKKVVKAIARQLVSALATYKKENQ